MAAALKKNTENQSIAAAVLRWSVGSANAASTASGGRASMSARSEPAIATHAATAMATQATGNTMWRESSRARQRQSVQNASGQAGHVNHTSSRSIANTCAGES